MKSVTKAVVGLHNFLMKKNHEGDNQYCPPNYIDRGKDDHVLPGDWRQEQNHISALKMLEELVPIISRKVPRLSGTSLKTIS